MNSFKYILLFILLNVAIVVSQVSILLLGDSLTVGYTQRNQTYHPYAIQLKKDFEKASIQADIVVNGQSGDRVVDGRFERRLRESLKQQAAKGKSFDWVVILGGTNDCFNRYKSDKIFAALKNLYLICESSGANVLALTILDFNNDEHEPTRLQINDLIRNYTDPKVTPFDIASKIPNNSTYYQPDGIHLTPYGYDTMGDLIFLTFLV
ncbi:SGNH hydrolase [Rhizophagus irregularis]|uniref:SGNH hydrolase n=4 Tax=Rhizophagus irregularis TaxID=588596 RepID=A0A2N0REQ5_9GLOM|nr:SGNH hydrolase-type esterase domain-containing protein [Rhizophagus irregularis DAOM 181602=DAOM 197198]EXX70268.1 hypothetical protein RirG_089120 [Rhizophagus irregularis DAOM 197198w]PKC61801.1 SGNH hydrolase [Rhizophagus irregularis]POG81602.1 SGNH hydrolase-type esterase domain-containing protein [Rhizophagus irregularis DAOM 181602=DAOM 197198]UZO00892.1 hypothetical protein OCT59_012006 [Rhizophagus irregularis]CAB4484707.1 unnamed protein product [Rhizophagus irregularis]|eukprot:XP_025188468.1 SGNH hydrolase-type esterase domain-containing protein [Rhizophagus irregularis DAOM 181602=DAOM 197198]